MTPCAQPSAYCLVDGQTAPSGCAFTDDCCKRSTARGLVVATIRHAGTRRLTRRRMSSAVRHSLSPCCAESGRLRDANPPHALLPYGTCRRALRRVPELHLASDRDPCRPRHGQQPSGLIMQRRFGRALAAVAAGGPGCDDAAVAGARAGLDPCRHPAQQERRLVDGVALRIAIAAKPVGQSSADQRNSGATRPSSAARFGSGIQLAARTGRCA